MSVLLLFMEFGFSTVLDALLKLAEEHPELSLDELLSLKSGEWGLDESVLSLIAESEEILDEFDEKVQEITAEKAPVEQVKEFGHLKLSEPFKPEAMEADKPIMIVDARTKTPEKESVVKQLKKEKTKAAKPKKTKTASKKKEEVAI